MKQSTISRKQENKGMKAILDLTGQLSQVLKQFDGIYSCKLEETDGLTVESYMTELGVPRFVTKSGVKKGYTPGLINAAWNDDMLLKSSEGKVMGNCIYKNVAAKYMREENGGEKAYRVFASEEAALSAEGKAITRYQLVQVGTTKWNVRIILKGLLQSKHHDKESEKAEESEKSWAAIEECWIVVNEGKERKAVKVSKDRVQF
jgi:hypothetical protein